MPRRKEIQKNMRRGWRNLNRYWKLDLTNKIKYSQRLLSMVFERHSQPVVCWSGGKDSTVVLHLCLLNKPDIPVLYSDSGVDFPETNEFIKQLSKEWELNLHVAKPKRGEGFWDCVRKYGWPILGKTISMNVEQAIRAENIRNKMSMTEKLLAKNQIHLSTRCCKLVRENPSKELEETLCADVKTLGLKADESRARARLWTDHGDYYFVKRYFGRNRGIWKANPISIWTESDIWKYHEINSIPHCKLYDMGHLRNGCWPCAMGVRNGQLKRLRISHPKLFKYLITKTEMGKELLKTKFTLMGVNKNEMQVVAKYDLAHFIELRPCFFDNL